MEFYEAIAKRKTVREWQDAPVSKEVLGRILNAGLAAPTNDHLRNWEFVVLEAKEDKEKALQFILPKAEMQVGIMAERLGDAPSPSKEMYDYALPKQYTMLSEAAYVVIPLFKAPSIGGQYVNELNHFASIWCVIENILLAATAEGLGTSLRIPVGEEAGEVMKVLGVPEGYYMACYLGIGHPAENLPKITQHTFSAEEKTHFGKW